MKVAKQKRNVKESARVRDVKEKLKITYIYG